MAERRPESTMPSSKHGVKSKSRRRDTARHPSMSWQVAMVERKGVGKKQTDCARRVLGPAWELFLQRYVSQPEIIHLPRPHFISTSKYLTIYPSKGNLC